MPGTISESVNAQAAETEALDQNSENWDARQTDTPSEWYPDTKDNSMKSNASQRSSETTSVLSKSSATSKAGCPSVEVAKEAKEKEPKRTSAWLKNIGNGMRTLRLRKSMDKSSSNTGSLGKGIKMQIMDDEQKGSNSTQESGGPPVSQSPSPSKSHSAAPPNVIPPFENDPPVIDASAISKDQKRNSGSVSGSMKREHGKKWRKLGSGGSSAVNGNSSSNNATTGNGTVPTLQQKSNGGSVVDAEIPHKADPTRFIGEGLSFKAKLIGVLEVSGPRGDRICQEALSELKMAVKAAGEHKQKVTIHVALDGLRLRDEKTGDCLYHHQVHKISFIAQDLTDSRAFGYIFGSPDTGHRFFGIKTEKSASQVVMAMRDLFQVVFDLKKKEIERAKQQLEMQQKFLATRAAEIAPRTENKAGRIAETYIEGACALSPSSPRTSSAPAEADLLNLEVELSSLQEGLENIHSNLMEARHHQNVPFNRGSTTSVSSDPMNPRTSTSFKYSSNLISSSNHPHNNTNRVTSTSSVGCSIADPFGDSFDPFDGEDKFIPSDPFSNVDPFPLPKPGPLLAGGDSYGPDPFTSTTAGNFTFTYTDSHTNNTKNAAQIPISSKYCKLSETARSRPEAMLQDTTSKPTPVSEKHPLGWTASFEDNFIPDGVQSQADLSNGPNSLAEASIDGSGVNLDIFTDLDPLGSGRMKPFIDRKDFFQELKNPPKKNLKYLSTFPGSVTTSQIESSSLSAITPATTASVLSQPIKLDVAAIPTSFSTNFNPATRNTTGTVGGGIDFDSHFKVLNNKNELKTSSIRVRLPLSTEIGNDTPPNYSPPPPPASQVSNSIYFENPNPGTTSALTLGGSSRNGSTSSKKSPQLLKRMTISSTSGVATTIPRTISLGPGRHTIDSTSTDEIPNLTPPPRPPHSGTLNRNSTVIPTAVPRPLSGKSELNRQNSVQMAPEPPPRPFQTIQMTNLVSTSNLSSLPLVSPPPLPPKKQPIMQTLSNSSTAKIFFNSTQGKHNVGSRISEAGSVGSNDLPLPLPCRKNGSENNTISIPRYAVPPSFDNELIRRAASISLSSPTPSRRAKAEPSSTAQLSNTTSNLTMEQALGQVATLNLGQLASKLELPVEQLSSLTLQQLASRLASMELKDKPVSRKASTTSSGFETNFDPEFDTEFSTASAPSTMEGAANRDQRKTTGGSSNFDRYAVFRELTVEDASGFSIGGNSMNEVDYNKEGSGSGSRTLTSRDSSSERTLQADDEPENPMATMDDVTDVNFSDGDDKSILDDEIVDSYLDLSAKLPEWATFDSNFDDQCIPLDTGFNKSEDSPSWGSDEMLSNPLQNAYPLSVEKRPKTLKTTKIDGQFEFQPFKKQNSRIDDAVEEDEQTLDPLVQSSFQRQSSGSSKHSDRCAERISDYSGSSTGRINRHERTGSGRRLELPLDSREVIRKSRTSSYSSSGRKYSRGESDDLDEDYHHRHHRSQAATTPSSQGHREDRRRHYYVDDNNEGGVENPSFDPTFPHPSSVGGSVRGKSRHPRTPREDFEDDDNEENDLEEDDDRSYSSRHSHNSNLSPGSRHRHHHRRRHPPKYYQTHSQSLHRRGRDDRYVPRDGRRTGEYSPERYSNHESDFDDSYEDENGVISRRGRSGSGREKDYYVSRDPDYSSRPTSSGSARKNHSTSYQHHRGNSRDTYYKESRHGHRHQQYNSKDKRHHQGPYEPPDDVEHDEISDYSGEDENGAKYRRTRGRRPPPQSSHSRHHHHRRVRTDRDCERYYSPSWDSESSPPPGELGSHKVDKVGERRRHSAGKSGRPSSETLCITEPFERPPFDKSGGNGTRGIYQSELALSTNKSNNKLSSNEFNKFDKVSTTQQSPHQHPRQKSDPVTTTSFMKGEIENVNVNKKTLINNFSIEENHTSIFDDNFVQPTNAAEPEKYENVGEYIEAIESSSQLPQPSDRTTISNTSGQSHQDGESEVFFTSSFDLKQDASAMILSESPIAEENDVKTPDVCSDGKLLTMISEESHNSNNSNTYNTNSDITTPKDALIEQDEIEMKKSDSFNIFEREKDPFADDDFFK